MKIAIFGATGGTGSQLVTQALDRGDEVVALARQPQAVRVSHPRLRVEQGDVLSPDSVMTVVDGVDAVLSALGIGYRRHATTVYSVGVANVLAAMVRSNVRRLLVVSTSSLTLPAREEFAEWLLARYVLHPALKRPYADMALMEDQVLGSDRDWTLVRAARLTNGGRTGTYRTRVDGKLSGCWSISRADLAEYLLDHILDTDSHRTTVEIAY